ncbi:MAG: thioredoxin domain-containing protein [Thiohalomonadales bacterium]
MTEKYTNQLVNETSPYLLQHAHNPVNWYPWNDLALHTAKSENKLILLSIGYSACHWCHVMAHESFENPDIAAVMNDLFINIKVDREERPDLDKIYQTAHQFLNQRGGGWPLTIILTPDDQVPFFAGTYFPNTEKHGMPAFTEILNNVTAFYQDNKKKINQQANSILTAFSQLNNSENIKRSEINPQILDQSRKQLGDTFDKRYAGFGKAPKFPHPTNLERLMRHWLLTLNNENCDDSAKQIVYLTLHAMASGGIYDQLGGGFYRYSVDDYWQIPHFEKMLYDNGQLLALYAQASVLFANKTFTRIAAETADWVIREMQSPQGAYYSTLDADTEAVEGKTYRWDISEIKDILDDHEYFYFAQIYGLHNKANFDGFWHLHLSQNLTELAATENSSEKEIEKIIHTAKLKLFDAREQRTQPDRDEKLLTSWNGLMIKGMMLAGRLLKNKNYIQSAQNAIDFIHSTMFRNKRLYATHKDGKSHIMAYLDDYAFMLDALIESLQTQWRNNDLLFAIDLADTMLEFFEDKKDGGFFFTANDHEKLIQRPKVYADEAIPAGNGIAALSLSRLGHLIANSTYIESSGKCIQNAWSQILSYPAAHGAMLHAVEELLYPATIIIIRGSDNKLITDFQNICLEHYKPSQLNFFIPDISSIKIKENSVLTVFDKYQSHKSCIAYICNGTKCLAPIENRDEFIHMLNLNSAV